MKSVMRHVQLFGDIVSPISCCVSMKIFSLLAFFIFTLIVPATTYAANACSAVTSVLPSVSSADLDGCVCDSKLRNLHGSLLPPFRIIAACNLKWSSGKPINLATQQIQLHQFTNGDYPLGTIFVSGSATFNGVLTNNEMGAVSVRLNKSLLRDGSVPLFYQLNVDELPKNVLIPKHLGNVSCLEGRASVSVKGLRIVMGENDEAGVWPLEHNFRKASLEKICTN
jgi:hypothetical protein